LRCDFAISFALPAPITVRIKAQADIGENPMDSD
jgi:hypothetical protein